ncbi:hypothetical protein GCM10011351_20800 [Paraliobacillus quinghaiensis]|uniref:Uncharacterized protein n=1 Tax=Paraliobacillus quinghaiensis TaxID=470815 RepID=A0A917TRU9_9BACI|nr:hypothetical protein [Paraliobacillus quinghaiensis]GGM34640.1 hypothetical protein GCM10011351_20800 [Paraliobacillus quinghaiensis]
MSEELNRLKQENSRLREIIGSWRRKAQEKNPYRNRLFKEGYNRMYSEHYKVYIVDYIPGDLDIKEVIEEIETKFMPTIRPFSFKRLDYSTKYKAWIVEVCRTKEYTKLREPFEVRWSE